jgi:hypothetical protein
MEWEIDWLLNLIDVMILFYKDIYDNNSIGPLPNISFFKHIEFFVSFISYTYVLNFFWILSAILYSFPIIYIYIYILLES